MTQRTHDLSALALVSYRFLAYPPGQLNWETTLGIGITAIVGGLIPDIDNVASPAWRHKLMPWEGKATRMFLEGHRHLSHSLIGLFLFSYTFKLLLTLVHVPHVDVELLRQAFFLGHLSHLIADSLTLEGVPWFYPLPFKLGFPPVRFFRVRTGSWFERLAVFPAILGLTIYIYYIYRDNLRILFPHLPT